MARMATQTPGQTSPHEQLDHADCSCSQKRRSTYLAIGRSRVEGGYVATCIDAAAPLAVRFETSEQAQRKAVALHAGNREPDCPGR